MIAGANSLRGSTPRTQQLAEEAMERDYGQGYVEREALRESHVPDPARSPMLQAAHRFAHVFTNLTPVIRPGELVVGALVRGDKEAWDWKPDGYPTQVDKFAPKAPADRPDIREMAERGLLSPLGSLNHKIVDYANYIRTGSRALAQRARQIAKTAESPEAAEFATAFAMGHETLMRFGDGYGAACRELAEAAPDRAAELHEIARICDRVPAEPATTFHEALQSLWFAYLVAGDATGRVDVYLNDFYQADLAAGRITPDRAQELIECFMIKLHGDVMEGYVNVSSVQTMTLGGLLPDGSDASNDLTRLFLRAVRSVRLLRPSVYLRCHENTPEDLLDFSVTMLGDGLAEPCFYGDRPIVDWLVRLGLPPEIARDYAPSGCTEIVSPGRGNWGAPSGWINLALLVDETLREAAQNGAVTEEALWEALTRRIDELADICRICNLWLDEQTDDVSYESTLLMPVCLGRCKDVMHGGAETHYGHWEGVGLPNAADMIYAAVQLGAVRGEGLSRLFERLDANDSALLAEINALPKFGNDAPAVDAIAARLVELMSDALETRCTPLRRALVLGHLAGGENMHICYGLRRGPTLDGRRAGETLADSLAGVQGRTLAGPTAVIKSLCRLDHSRLVAGNVSTLRLSPSDFRTAEGRRNVVSLIRSFVELGGSQLQINLVDSETLPEAQAHPEQHAGLLVRVAGYSADFTEIGRSLQNEIIARTGVGV